MSRNSVLCCDALAWGRSMFVTVHDCVAHALFLSWGGVPIASRRHRPGRGRGDIFRRVSTNDGGRANDDDNHFQEAGCFRRRGPYGCTHRGVSVSTRRSQTELGMKTQGEVDEEVLLDVLMLLVPSGVVGAWNSAILSRGGRGAGGG